MKIQNAFYVIALLISASCTEPVDFTQGEDLLLTPVVESSIFFFNADAEDFFVGGMEQSEVSESVDIDIFNNRFITNNIIKLELEFEMKNSINRAYELQLDFLDINKNVLDTFTVNTPASPTNEIIFNVQTEVYEEVELRRILRTRSLESTLRMLPGEPITPNTIGEIDVRSKAVLHLSIGG